MSNIMFNNATSGLNAAQNALNTTSNNLSNYNVNGYSRQTTIFNQMGSSLSSGVWVGGGVYVSSIHREYDAFITNQLRAAQSQNSGLTAHYQQMTKIDNMMSDTTNNLSTSMQDFFTTMKTLVSNASDPAARQTLLGKSDGLVNQFHVMDNYLREQEKQVNESITTSVGQINNYAARIADLNDEISRMTAAGGGVTPNDLLDQRDQLISELNKFVGVEASIQEGGIVNVAMANGYSLVQGKKANQLAAIPSSANPGRTTIAYVDDIAGNIELPEKLITGGSLGGLLAFRREDLDQARNNLGQMALVFADALNKQHQSGYDLNGDAGGPLFNMGNPSTVANAKNTGNASLNPSVTDGSAVKASDYKMEFDGTNWTVTRLSDNATVSPKLTTDASGNVTALEFDGMTVDVAGNPGAKDSFILQPVKDVISGLEVAIRDPSKIALASDPTAGESDNRNAQALFGLQEKKTIEGKKTFNDAYASMVSDVGSKTNTLKTSSAAQEKVVNQLTAQQQSISGVNLDEEYGNLQRFQQYYLANAQVLQTAQALFDALIQIR